MFVWVRSRIRITKSETLVEIAKKGPGKAKRPRNHHQNGRKTFMEVVRQQARGVVPIASTSAPFLPPGRHNAGSIPVSYEISSC